MEAFHAGSEAITTSFYLILIGHVSRKLKYLRNINGNQLTVAAQHPVGIRRPYNVQKPMRAETNIATSASIVPSFLIIRTQQ